MPNINAPTPDATTATNGKIRLTGDLAGTAASPQLSTSSIFLGYAQVTTNVTTTSSTFVQATGLTSTVTVPSGGRRVKITVYCDAIVSSSSGNAYLSIWDGAVGTGTQIQQWESFITTPNGNPSGVHCVAVVTPSAGSKTYNVGIRVSAGTLSLFAGATFPAFILVELM